MSLADAVLSALKGFAGEVATWTNQGHLVSIQGHIAQIETAVVTDVQAGETAAKEILAELYTAFHGHAAAPPPVPAEPTSAPAEPTIVQLSPTANAGSGIVSPAPTVQTITLPAAAAPAAETPTAEPAPAAADPTPAPDTTTEASSAPSNTPSTATAPDSPAASA